MQVNAAVQDGKDDEEAMDFSGLHLGSDEAVS